MPSFHTNRVTATVHNHYVENNGKSPILIAAAITLAAASLVAVITHVGMHLDHSFAESAIATATITVTGGASVVLFAFHFLLSFVSGLYVLGFVAYRSAIDPMWRD